MQLSIFSGLIQRIVFYGCEIYAGQLKAGDDYSRLMPAFSICLLDGVLWNDSEKVHHAFRFTDRESGRTLNDTLEIHRNLEKGRSPIKQVLNTTKHCCTTFRDIERLPCAPSGFDNAGLERHARRAA